MATRRDPEKTRQAAAALGARIRRVRETSGYNQTRFAELIEADRNTVGRWERGDGLPDALNIEAISRVCGVSADWLLRGVPPSQAAETFKEWRESPHGRAASQEALLFLETLPLGVWTPSRTFYDLALLAFEQGLSQEEAIDAARVTAMRQ
jgi:transcriptional regulator with XRE-family HTH domain